MKGIISRPRMLAALSVIATCFAVAAFAREVAQKNL